MQKQKKKICPVFDLRGFTLVELLIVIVISAIILAAAIPIYGSFTSSSQLSDNTADTVQLVRTARQRAVSRVNNSPHGVLFEINVGADDRVIAYQGVSFATRDSTFDRIIVLASPISLSTTLTGDEVNFSMGLGEADNTGTVTLTHDVTGTGDVTINSFGKIEQN